MFYIHTVLCVTLLQGVGLSALIVPSVKVSRMASTIMTASTAELGIRNTKGPSGLGTTL